MHCTPVHHHHHHTHTDHMSMLFAPPPPAAVAILALAIACSANDTKAQQIRYATHDWSMLDPRGPDTWADVKVVGDGKTYSVGTAQVGPPITAGLVFSNRFATHAGASGWGNYGTRQAVVLQIAEPGQPQGILRQTIFHGVSSPLSGSIGRSSFAHAISVWPASLHDDTRIAICGSTKEERLPASAPGSNTAAAESGFIAVFDGQLNLRWSHHFFEDNINARTVITDVSIRVEDGVEYVTYCGASNNGNDPGTQANTMLPIRPFQPPPAIGGDVYAGGATNNSNSNSTTNPLPNYTQWDGLVGRLSAPFAPATPLPTMDFHSLVGGGGDDILLGIAQNSLDRFVAVGSTRGPVITGLAFPLTDATLFGNGSMQFHNNNPWELGTFVEFEAPDMTVTSPGTAQNPTPDYYLKLKQARLIGSVGSQTVARDVLWQNPQSGLGFLYVVGSTNYAGLAADFPAAQVGNYYGGSSGYLVASIDLPQQQWLTGRYINQFVPTSPGALPPTQYPELATSTGAHGIAGWNEYPNHITVVGWSEFSTGTRILTTSCFREPVNQPGFQVSVLRQHELNPIVDPAPRNDMPGGYLDPQFYSTLNILPVSSHLGKATSGATAVDERGHVAVVGYTRLPSQPTTSPPTPHHPIDGPPGEFRGPNPQNALSTQVDALRLELDMLPLGTHFIDADSTFGQLGIVGGTTPTCAISQFGNTLGAADLQRIYLNIDGDPQPNGGISILVDRPTDGALITGGLFIGLPSLYPSPWPGIELFADPGMAQLPFIFTFATTSEALRVPIFPLPGSGGEFTVQFVSLLANTNFCSTVPACANTTPCLSNLALSVAASPALWITY